MAGAERRPDREPGHGSPQGTGPAAAHGSPEDGR